MSRRVVVLLIVLCGVAALGGLVWIVDRGRDEGAKIALQIPRDPPLPPQGAPALQVKLGVAEPFSKEDVRDYFTTHNLPTNGTSTTDFTVDMLEFLTNQEVTTRLNGASTGLTEADKIGFATLKGHFIFNGPNSSSARFTRAYAAFDARTGNLLMVGTLE